MTLRRRLLLLLLPALAVLMLGGAFVDRWVAAASTQDAYDQALDSAALAAAASLHLGRDGVTDTSGDAGTSSPAEVTRQLAIIAPDGALLAGDAALARLAPPRTSGTAGPVFADAQFRGQAVRLVSREVRTPEGLLTLILAETRERREQTQRVMLLGKLLVDFAELDLTLLVVWAAVYFGLQPLGRLREQAEAHSRRELQRFDESRVPGELRPLVVAFNRVLELLHDAAQAQRRFVADAAHHLRTPVAGLLAQIEVLRSEPRAAPLEAELALLQRGAQSLAHSANQLLSLARAEPVSAQETLLAPVALETLVQELVERHVGRADRAGIDLGAEPQPAGIAGDAWLLEDLLTNLIDNALKYTPRGGRVTVRSGSEGARAFVEVEDDGPGIPESERARVRERFYRRAGSPGIGVGLGLAIVDEIARAHRGSFTIGSGAGGRGARLRVSFPQPASESAAPEAGAVAA
jgi:two-component system, OmpR family, sensor histidine kinase TctE